jgi:hypothetical protein
MSEKDIQDDFEAGEETEGCPVVPLGHDRGLHFYRTRSGQVVAVPAARHSSRAVIEDLFGGDMTWPIAAFPYDKSKKSDPEWDLDGLRQWLFQKNHEAGFFDPDRNLRGAGVWREKRGSGLIVHCGDQLKILGQDWTEAGCQIEDKTYPATRALAKPAEVPASAQEGRELVGFFGSWNWLSPLLGSGLLAAMILAGWLCCAVLAGALDWRPHVFVTGDKGTGKSRLFKLIKAILTEDWIEDASAPSEAGIRQMLGGAARAVIIDEMEHAADNMHAKNLVQLARLASTEGQGKVYRGSAEGRAQSWAIRATYLFSGINPPPFKSQDASRIAVLELGELPHDPDAAERVDEGIAHWTERGPEIRARILEGFPRFLENLHTYRHALSGRGADGRQCDQFGTLLAMHDVLVDDQATTFEAADRVATALMPSELVPGDEETNHRDCLDHILTTPVEVEVSFGDKKRRSLGELVRDQFLSIDGTRDRVLGTYGLKVLDRVEGDPSTRYLVIANKHRGLEQIFHGTPWHSGAWKTALGRLEYALKVNTAPRFGGVQSRAVWIPMETVGLMDGLPKPPPEQGPVDIDDTSPPG